MKKKENKIVIYDLDFFVILTEMFKTEMFIGTLFGIVIGTMRYKFADIFVNVFLYIIVYFFVSVAVKIYKEK